MTLLSGAGEASTGIMVVVVVATTSITTVGVVMATANIIMATKSIIMATTSITTVVIKTNIIMMIGVIHRRVLGLLLPCKYARSQSVISRMEDGMMLCE